MKYALGIDIGGTFIRAAIVSDIGKIIMKERVNTGTNVLDNALTLAKKISENNNIIGIGIGAPGPLDIKRGIILNPPNLKIKNLNLLKPFQKKFKMPIVVDNDANLALWGENWTGAAQKVTNAVMLTLGTGVGGGIIIDKKLFQGSFGAGAELGHTIINLTGLKDNDGGIGHLEAFLGTKGILRLGQNKFNSIIELAQALGEKNKTAHETIARIGAILGAECASSAAIFNPEVVVIGGGVTTLLGRFFMEITRKEFKKRVFSPCGKGVKIKKAQLSDWAGVIGAARLIFE